MELNLVNPTDLANNASIASSGNSVFCSSVELFLFKISSRKVWLFTAFLTWSKGRPLRLHSIVQVLTAHRLWPWISLKVNQIYKRIELEYFSKCWKNEKDYHKYGNKYLHYGWVKGCRQTDDSKATNQGSKVLNAFWLANCTL